MTIQSRQIQTDTRPIGEFHQGLLPNREATLRTAQKKHVVEKNVPRSFTTSNPPMLPSPVSLVMPGSVPQFASGTALAAGEVMKPAASAVRLTSSAPQKSIKGQSLVS